MNQVQMQMPPLSKVNKIIMITTAALFLLESLVSRGAGFSLASILGLSAKGLGNGLIFQLFTYPLIEKQLLAVIFNGLLLWFLGSELEAQWGRKRYIQFLLAATLTAGIVYVLIGLTFLSHTSVSSFPLSGLQGIGASLCVAYAILYPDRTFMFMMIFPMKAKWFCALLVGMELYTGFFSPMGALAWGHLAAMAGGFGMLIWFTKAGAKKPKGVSNFTFKMEKKKGKAHLSLVEDEKKEDDKNHPPKYWH
tara:strand:+ start:5795 stop:6544 length:750 start_codon:yes stop_codon:yes gene_type:complete